MPGHELLVAVGLVGDRGATVEGVAEAHADGGGDRGLDGDGAVVAEEHADGAEGEGRPGDAALLGGGAAGAVEAGLATDLAAVLAEADVGALLAVLRGADVGAGDDGVVDGDHAPDQVELGGAFLAAAAVVAVVAAVFLAGLAGALDAGQAVGLAALFGAGALGAVGQLGLAALLVHAGGAVGAALALAGRVLAGEGGEVAGDLLLEVELDGLLLGARRAHRVALRVEGLDVVLDLAGDLHVLAGDLDAVALAHLLQLDLGKIGAGGLVIEQEARRPLLGADVDRHRVVDLGLGDRVVGEVIGRLGAGVGGGRVAGPRGGRGGGRGGRAASGLEGLLHLVAGEVLVGYGAGVELEPLGEGRHRVRLLLGVHEDDAQVHVDLGLDLVVAAAGAADVERLPEFLLGLVELDVEIILVHGLFVELLRLGVLGGRVGEGHDNPHREQAKGASEGSPETVVHGWFPPQSLGLPQPFTPISPAREREERLAAPAAWGHGSRGVRIVGSA